MPATEIINDPTVPKQAPKPKQKLVVEPDYAPPPIPPLPINPEDFRSTHGYSDKAHWVIPGILMQGARPGFGKEDTVEDARDLVDNAKCTVFVSLQKECAPEEGSVLLDSMSGGYLTKNPKSCPIYSKNVMAVLQETKFLYYGIKGMEPARSVRSLNGAIYQINQSITKNNEVVYIHCGGGVGRAGLVAACILGSLYVNMTADEALEYVETFCQLRNPDTKAEDAKKYHSPEEEGQKEQVREFFASDFMKKIRFPVKPTGECGGGS